MAWPYDARDQTFAARSQITSDFLNEVQDRIYPIYESKTKIFTVPLVNNDGWVHSNWEGTKYGWCVTGSSGHWLEFPCAFECDVKILKVEAKIYNDTASTSEWTMTVYKADFNFDTAGNAPGLGTAIADITDSGIAASDWDVIATGTLSSVIGADETLIVKVGPTLDVDDVISGVRVTYYPLG